jgi:hypothetical protein
MSSDLSKDVLLAASSVVIMLPPFATIEQTSEAVERIARAILAERERREAEIEKLTNENHKLNVRIWRLEAARDRLLGGLP